MPSTSTVVLIHSILFAVSWSLLLACSTTAPAHRYSGFLYYHHMYQDYYFGVFGYCNNYLNTNRCTTQLGYSIYGLFQRVDGEGGNSKPLDLHFSYLTKYLILIPIACIVTFGAWILTMLQSRRGRILYSSSVAAFIAFAFSLSALVMEELMFGQLYNGTKDVPGSIVGWGTPRYLLMIAVVSSFCAIFTGIYSARLTRKANGISRTTRGGHSQFDAVPLGPYMNLDNQDGHGAEASLLAPNGAPARSLSPGPFENPYESGRLSYGGDLSPTHSRGPSPAPLYDDPKMPSPVTSPAPFAPRRTPSPSDPIMYEDPYGHKN